MASSSPSLSPSMMKEEESINWAELPPELTSSILLRLGAIEILENAQKVCGDWRRVCRDPFMWRKIDLRNRGIFVHNYQSLCRRAVDRSEGGLTEINIGNFATDSLLTYIANRSRNLKCLRLAVFYPITEKGLFNAVTKLQFLEELDISHCLFSELDLKAVGRSCPLLKTLKLSRHCFSPESECDNEALAIAETMPELRYLELYGNRLTNTGLSAILDNCLHLEHLDLRRCFYIKLSGDLEKRCYERIKDLRQSNE